MTRIGNTRSIISNIKLIWQSHRIFHFSHPQERRIVYFKCLAKSPKLIIVHPGPDSAKRPSAISVIKLSLSWPLSIITWQTFSHRHSSEDCFKCTLASGLQVTKIIIQNLSRTMHAATQTQTIQSHLSIMHLYQKTSPFDVEYDRDVSMICEEAYLDKCLPVPVL